MTYKMCWICRQSCDKMFRWWRTVFNTSRAYVIARANG